MDALPRLGEATDVRGVTADLRFALDDRGRAHVAGTCRMEATVRCCGCLRDVAVEVLSPIDFRAVATVDEAQTLWPRQDAVVCDGETPVAELIEDDLLMSLPEIACADRAACPHALFAAKAPAEERRARSPFAALKGRIGTG